MNRSRAAQAIMKKAYIQSYGCQMNEHDTYRMMGVLAADGYEMTSAPEDASLIVVNTCSVREKPENKVYSFLGVVRKLKEKNPELKMWYRVLIV